MNPTVRDNRTKIKESYSIAYQFYTILHKFSSSPFISVSSVLTSSVSLHVTHYVVGSFPLQIDGRTSPVLNCCEIIANSRLISQAYHYSIKNIIR